MSIDDHVGTVEADHEFSDPMVPSLHVLELMVESG